MSRDMVRLKSPLPVPLAEPAWYHNIDADITAPGPVPHRRQRAVAGRLGQGRKGPEAVTGDGPPHDELRVWHDDRDGQWLGEADYAERDRTVDGAVAKALRRDGADGRRQTFGDWDIPLFKATIAQSDAVRPGVLTCELFRASGCTRWR